MPAALGAARVAALTYGSIAAGAAMLAFGIVGLCGACRRSACCLCLFGLAACALLTCVAAAIAMNWQVFYALTEWQTNDFRLVTPATAAGGALPLPALDPKAMSTLKVLHSDVAALYNFCEPRLSNVSAIVSDLDARPLRPPRAGRTLGCTKDGLAPFEAWVQSHCLNASAAGFAGSDGLARLGEIALCRNDLEALGSGFALDARSARASWLFCACGRPLAREIRERWFGGLMVALNAAMVYLAVLVCAARAACKAAKKARRRKKDDRVELMVLRKEREERQRQRDGGEAYHGPQQSAPGSAFV